MRRWPFPRANGEHTIAVLRRLRAAFPDEALIVLWDGAPYHRAKAVREAATALEGALRPWPEANSTNSRSGSKVGPAAFGGVRGGVLIQCSPAVLLRRALFKMIIRP